MNMGRRLRSVFLSLSCGGDGELLRLVLEAASEASEMYEFRALSRAGDGELARLVLDSASDISNMLKSGAFLMVLYFHDSDSQTVLPSDSRWGSGVGGSVAMDTPPPVPLAPVLV